MKRLSRRESRFGLETFPHGEGDAKDWAISLKQDYSSATVAGMIVKAKQFFQAAIDRELIGKSPFRGC
jgi:hypothetical protein